MNINNIPALEITLKGYAKKLCKYQLRGSVATYNL